MWQIIIDNEIIKEYKYEAQAITYCFLNGYIYSGRGWYFLDQKVTVKHAN